jgi:large subunit ribosomal protein L24
MKIKKGDKVQITTGKDAGKSGKIIDINLQTRRVIVEGLNLYKKHVKPRRQGEKGEILDLPRPMNISNVSLVCSGCKKPVRIGYRVEDKKKTRVCRKCEATI